MQCNNVASGPKSVVTWRAALVTKWPLTAGSVTAVEVIGTGSRNDAAELVLIGPYKVWRERMDEQWSQNGLF